MEKAENLAGVYTDSLYKYKNMKHKTIYLYAFLY